MKFFRKDKKFKKIGEIFKKNGKKTAIFAIFLSFSLFLCGCDSSTMLNCGHITNITSAHSTNYAVKVTLDEDERVEEKSVGMQIMSSVAGLELVFGEELGEDYTLTFEKAGYWYNLTYLISQTSGATTEAGYLSYPEYGSRVFRFSSAQDATLTFRMVVGKTKTNEETGEEILVLTEPISQELTIDVKKSTEG